MRPETAVRVALITIPLSIVIAIVAAVTGVWFVFAVMLLGVVGQTVSLIANRRQLRGGR